MKIIFFDGYCSLCNGLIDFLMKIDSHRVLKFTSLQGETAKRSLISISNRDNPDTVIYLRNGTRYEKSSAILMIFSDLGGIYRSAKLFFVIPKFIRDAIYNFMAKNRYRLFGKRNSCRLPTPQEQSQFLA